MKAWYKFLHSVCVLFAIYITFYGALQAIPLIKWESQDYALFALAVLLFAGIFKGMSDQAVQVETTGESNGKDSTKEPAVSVP